MTTGYKSKTGTTWIAMVGGSFGLHRFYLHGLRDRWAWWYAVPTLFGLYGVERAQHFGLDDHLSWLLIPLLGLMLAGTLLRAVVYGLVPDETWNARYNPGGPAHRTDWLTIVGVALALALGTGVLMATLAFSAQRYFEYQAEAEPQANSQKLSQ